MKRIALGLKLVRIQTPPEQDLSKYSSKQGRGQEGEKKSKVIKRVGEKDFSGLCNEKEKCSIFSENEKETDSKIRIHRETDVKTVPTRITGLTIVCQWGQKKSKRDETLKKRGRGVGLARSPQKKQLHEYLANRKVKKGRTNPRIQRTSGKKTKGLRLGLTKGIHRAKNTDRWGTNSQDAEGSGRQGGLCQPIYRLTPEGVRDHRVSYEGSCKHGYAANRS